MNYEKMTKAELINKLKSIEVSIENTKRKGIEKMLETLKGSLEQQLIRYTELEKANKALLEEIKQRKQAEKIAREQSRLLDLLFKHSIDSIVLLDKDYNFIRVSENYAKVCQRDSSEFPGHNHFEFYPSNLKDEFDEAKKGKSIYQKSSRPFTFPDHPEWGTTYWDLGLVPILDKEGEIELFLFTLKDVTDCKRAEDLLQEKEQQMRLFMLSTYDSIWNWNMVAGTVERSIGFERAFGYAADEVLPGIEWWADRLHPDDKERVWQTFNDEVAGGKAFCGYEYRFRCRDGSYANIEDSVCIIRDDTGKAVRSLGAMRDITERKKAEEVRQEHSKALEHKNIALSEVLGQLEIEKKQIKDNVIANAENLILPIIQKLKLAGVSHKYLKLLQSNIQELTSSFGTKVSSRATKLTPREIELCDMIKNGFTNKEMAKLLNISIVTVEKHRNNIRGKLNIVNKDINLSSVLKTL